MYVKDKMSKSLCTVKPNTTISEVLDIMEANHYHRIPVVDDNNHLLGLLTAGNIKQSNANSSLSVFELNYLLNKLKASDVMIKDVVTVNPDALLEEAASILREHEIGCLPVIENGILVGIITQNDIFDSFIDILGYNEVGTRYVINIKEDKVGIMYKIAECFVQANISISNLAVYNTERGLEIVVIAVGDNSEYCGDYLKNAGWDVTSIMNLNK